VIAGSDVELKSNDASGEKIGAELVIFTVKVYEVDSKVSDSVTVI
jgi:hypothetical protein